ncbi:MAG: aldehyde ferredoxin oxidoreductase C-terminal domain-containing protein, partial [candidate division WOR-3 bacterium]
HKDIENVNTKELKKLCKLIKETIYPFLDFKVHYTGKYDTKKFLNLLTHVAMNHDFTHNGSKTFRFVMKENTPASNTLLYHIRKSESEKLKNNFRKAFEEMRKQYYDAIGWDERGIPKSSVLKEHGLEDVDKILEKVREKR